MKCSSPIEPSDQRHAIPVQVFTRGLCDYTETWERMIAFTKARTDKTIDQIWLLEHPSVFTQGLAGKDVHVRDPGPIPVIRTDRGGQVTYHGPGQLIAYCLFDLKRLRIGLRRMVSLLELSVIDVLTSYQVAATTRPGAPGIYVTDPHTKQFAKMGSLGLRIKKGCSYHGLALNVAMDLAPFARISPCGFKDLKMTQLCAYAPHVHMQTLRESLASAIAKRFGLHVVSCRDQIHGV